MQQHVRIARCQLLFPTECPSQCVYKTVLKSVLELTTVLGLCQGSAANVTKSTSSHIFSITLRDMSSRQSLKPSMGGLINTCDSPALSRAFSRSTTWSDVPTSVVAAMVAGVTNRCSSGRT